jgi:hypothetical protein
MCSPPSAPPVKSGDGGPTLGICIARDSEQDWFFAARLTVRRMTVSRVSGTAEGDKLPASR